jgi:hypothetical protein
MAEGWVCIKCGSSYGPAIIECYRCNAPPVVSGTFTGQPTTAAPLIPPPFVVTCEAVDTYEGGTK